MQSFIKKSVVASFAVYGGASAANDNSIDVKMQVENPGEIQMTPFAKENPGEIQMPQKKNLLQKFDKLQNQVEAVSGSTEAELLLSDEKLRKLEAEEFDKLEKMLQSDDFKQAQEKAQEDFGAVTAAIQEILPELKKKETPVERMVLLLETIAKVEKLSVEVKETANTIADFVEKEKDFFNKMPQMTQPGQSKSIESMDVDAAIDAYNELVVYLQKDVKKGDFSVAKKFFTIVSGVVSKDGDKKFDAAVAIKEALTMIEKMESISPEQVAQIKAKAKQMQDMVVQMKKEYDDDVAKEQTAQQAQ